MIIERKAPWEPRSFPELIVNALRAGLAFISRPQLLPRDTKVFLSNNNLPRTNMIKKVKSGYRLYSRKKNPKTGKRRNLGTFKTEAAAKKHEKDVQYFKRQ